MTTRAPLKTAAEYDVIVGRGRWRKYYCYLQRAGTTSGIKRQIRRRERRISKEYVRKDLE
jgi:hypothetical protein